MKSTEFINEGDDKSIADVQEKHPDVYAFLDGVIGTRVLKQATDVSAYNTANSHMVLVSVRPSNGLQKTKIALQQAGMTYKVMKNPINGNAVISGSVGKMHWSVIESGNSGNFTQQWRFALPHKDNETQYYTDRTMEGGVKII
jgi:hypothetical protein